MEQWLSMSPYSRPMLGLLAIVLAIFLIKFLIKQAFNMIKFLLVLGFLGLGAFFLFEMMGTFGKTNSAAVDFSVESEAEQTTPSQLKAQIVDADIGDEFLERGIIETRPFKYFLQKVSKLSNADIRKTVDDRTTYENLTDEPDLHRGEPYAAGRVAAIEVSKAELPADYGLPGWSVVKAICINSSHDIYALRILCKSDSPLYDTLKKGIADDAIPVINVAGFFFKNYARQPNDDKEPPQAKPLLICPEPESVPGEDPRQIMQQLQDTGNLRYLPTQAIDGPPADERLVLAVKLEKDSAKVRAFGEESAVDGNVGAFVKKAVDKLKERLPAEHAKKPAAVVLVAGGETTDARVANIAKELKALGVTRVCLKKDAPIVTTAASGK